MSPPVEAGANHEDRNGGIPGDLRRLLHEELGVQLQGLRAACSDRDVDRMRDHAHQLKGLAGYFGLSEFHEKTGLFQQAVTADEQARIDSILGELEAMANDIMKNRAVSGE
jgi:HPt (histidine-containing phosphotransfer) domain-containing protein